MSTCIEGSGADRTWSTSHSTLRDSLSVACHPSRAPKRELALYPAQSSPTGKLKPRYGMNKIAGLWSGAGVCADWGAAIAWLDACDGWVGGGTSCLPANSGGSSSACARARRGCASTRQDSPARAMVRRRRKSRPLTSRASTTIALRSGIRAHPPTEWKGENRLVTRKRSSSRNSCRRSRPTGSRPRR